MAKSKYADIQLRLAEIEQWAKDGLIDQEIAQRLGIATSTYYDYQTKHSEFADAIKRGKDRADYDVEQSLFKKALGYTVSLKKTFKVKNVIYDSCGKRIKETEELVEGFDEVHVPADTTAQIFWLKNRQPEKWRDKQDINMQGDMKFNKGGLDETLAELRKKD